MEAGHGSEMENQINDRIERWSKRRKDMINKILSNKRIPNVPQNEQKKIQDFFSQEAHEEMDIILEFPVEKGKLNLSSHRKRSKRGKK